MTNFLHFINMIDSHLPFHGVGLILCLLVISYWRGAAQRSRDLKNISRRYASTINASLDAIVVADQSGRILDFNLAAERLFGCSRHVAMTMNLAELVSPARSADAEPTDLWTLLAAGDPGFVNQRMKMEARHSSGASVPVEVSIGMTEASEGVILVGYIRDISDQLTAQIELTQARDEALTAMRAKSQFLAVMSHEMRTPLNGVLAVLDILSATQLNDHQRRFLAAAANSGELLQRHIDDLLRISELENQELTFNRSTFNVKDMINDVIAMKTAPAAAKGNRLIFDPAFPDIYIIEDRHRLTQILVNLISNANKFTQNGEVRIEAECRPCGDGGEGGEILEFVVTDDGVGIADEDQERIFDTFVTLDPTYRRASRGYGLGLAICRRVARAMGGDIGVESREGLYSRFRVWIPIRRPSPAILPKLFTASLERPFELPDGPSELRVLLVEDDDTNRLVAKEMLTRFGCKVTEAVDGIEAVRLAGAQGFDLILMDVNMPRLGGEDATRLMRRLASSGSSKAPIIGVTAHALPEERRKLLDAGMNEVLIKPLRARHLQALLRRLSDFPADFGETPNDASAPAAPGQPAGRETANVDSSVFAEMRAVLSPAMAEDRLERFLREIRELPTSLDKAWRNADLGQIAIIAHQHAGSAALFGAKGLREILLQIEIVAKHGERDRIPVLFADLNASIPNTLGKFATYAVTESTLY